MKRNVVYKKTTIRFDEETLEKVRKLAEKEGRSLGRQIVWMVKKRLESCENLKENER